MTGDSLRKLENLIGHCFRKRELLREALTHTSYAQEASETVRDNEQMEFLGDSILNFLVSVRLADSFPERAEGYLSRARARLVAATHLAVVAGNLGLGEFLRLGRGEEKTGGRAKPAILSNTIEALIAALYRDGGLKAARHFVDRFVLPADLPASADELFTIDYKSALQEFLQAARRKPGEYRVIAETGPDHRKVFTVEWSGGKNLLSRGQGGSKKAAEQQAAKLALEILKRSRVHG